MTRPRTHRRIALSCTALAAAAGVVIATQASPAAASNKDFSANYTKDKGATQWHRNATFKLKNTSGSAESKWKLEFDVSGDSKATVNSSWIAKGSQEGHHITVQDSGKGTVAARGDLAVDLGVDQPKGGSAIRVTGCKLNGKPFDCDDASPSGDTQPPTTPEHLKADAKDDGSIALDWDDSTDNEGVVGYEVFDSGKQIYAGSNVSEAVLDGSDAGIKPGTTYHLTVKAVDAAGNRSAASNAVKVTSKSPKKDTEPPTAPTSLKGEATGASTVHLSWGKSTDNVGVKGYRVYRKDLGDTPVTEVDAPTTEANISSLKAKTSYEFTVKAVDAAGNLSSASNLVQVTTKDQDPPVPASAPRDVKTMTWVVKDGPANVHHLGLVWDTPKGTSKTNLVRRYEVYIDGKYTTTVGFFDPTVPGYTFEHDGAAAGGQGLADIVLGGDGGKTHTVKIRAQMKSGKWTDFSEEEIFTTPAA
ncbi:fibronectin type III domain-containing protein [Streptomyces sp. NPDC002537]